jgi:hypothetical protein
VEAADPVGGQRVRVGHEVVVVVVRGERGAAASDGAPESEVLGHGGVGVHRREEGAEEQLTPFAVVKCDREISTGTVDYSNGSPLTHGVDCFKISVSSMVVSLSLDILFGKQKCPYGKQLSSLPLKKSAIE